MSAPKRRPQTSAPPKWIKPRLTRLVEEAPSGNDWLDEIKYDGYRMHARLDGGHIQLLTRTGLDWSHRYRATIQVLRACRKPRPISGARCARFGPIVCRCSTAFTPYISC